MSSAALMFPKLAVLIVVACAGCSRASPVPVTPRATVRRYAGEPIAGDPSALSGCYRISYTTATERREAWYFSLDTVAPRDLPWAGKSRTPPGLWHSRVSNQGETAFSYWMLIPGGARLHVGDGLSNSTLDFEARGDSLVGLDFPGTDTPLPDSRLPPDPVTARRVPCPPGNWEPATPRDSARG